MNKKMTAYRICFIAMAICINVVGGQIALVLRLPIYLDSIGTILAGTFLGPVYGMLPSFLSGIIMGMTTDIYSLYFAPVGMITGFMAGIAVNHITKRKGSIFLSALLIAIPGTIVSSIISVVLFHGITSSGSSLIVQLLSKTPLGLTGGAIVVQIITDYADRLIALFIVTEILKKLPAKLKAAIKGN